MRSKRTSLGKSFNEMMTILNRCEQKLHEATSLNNHIVLDPYDLGEIVFTAIMSDPEGTPEFVEALVKGWGTDAPNMRQSFKYRGKEADLMKMGSKNKILGDLEFRLPFPYCTLVVDDCNSMGAGHPNNLDQYNVTEMCLFLEERILDGEEQGDWYHNHGLRLGDTFISASAGFLVDGMHGFQLVPMEFHFTSGLPFDQTDWTSALPKNCPPIIADNAYNYGRTVHFAMMFWMAALYSPQLKKDLRQGLKPGVIHTPRRKERVFYEHTMMQIDPTKEVELKDPIGSHSKHRLHPVRGFWRTYKSGKRVWVKAHWRGDKELGVVTHDYNLEPEE